MGLQPMEGPSFESADWIEGEEYSPGLVVSVALLVEVDTAVESGTTVDEPYLEREQLFRLIHASTE